MLKPDPPGRAARYAVGTVHLHKGDPLVVTAYNPDTSGFGLGTITVRYLGEDPNRAWALTLGKADRVLTPAGLTLDIDTTNTKP